VFMVLSRRVTGLIVLIAGLGVGTSVWRSVRKIAQAYPRPQMEDRNARCMR